MTNFVQTKLATHLNLVVQPVDDLHIMVGNGEALSCGGECSKVLLKMGDALVTVDFILLPTYGVDPI